MVSGILTAWREVRAIVLALVGVTVLAWSGRKIRLALLFTTLLGWVFYFFRDPERTPVATSPDLIVAPADGKVTTIEWIVEPHFFKGPVRRVSIFLSVLDVHVQRAPYPGVVKFLRYQPGSFAPAFLRHTEENESNFIGFSTPRGPLAIKQIVGILARRIVCWVDLEDELERGERLGLIKFGSRVDLLLPPEAEILVHTGQQTYGGQTIMARWPGQG